MEIPAFFATYRDGSLMAADGRFIGTVPRLGDRLVPFQEATGSREITEERGPAVVLDCDSLGSRVFRENVLKRMRVRGSDIWFMTYIETVDDVFDSFNTNAEKLLAPYHTVLDDAEWEDIHGVSDSVIPTVYIHCGQAVCRRGRLKDVCTVLDSLADMGFYKCCILDADESLSAYDWCQALQEHPSTVPFVFGPASNVQIHGFKDAIVPFRV